MTRLGVRVAALLRKDLLLEASYPAALAWGILSMLLSLLTSFFIDALFGRRIVPHLEPYGRGYFAYVLLATAVFRFTGTGLSGFSRRLQAERAMGTMEAILTAPGGVPAWLAAGVVWNLGVASAEAAGYLLVGTLAFGIDLAGANLASAGLVLALSAISFAALGVLAGSVVVVLKHGHPVLAGLSAAMGLLGGVYVPVTVLPAPLRAVAALLPVTYAVDAAERAAYLGATPWDLRRPLVVLLVFAVVLPPLAAAAFRRAVDLGRDRGDLGRY